MDDPAVLAQANADPVYFLDTGLACHLAGVCSQEQVLEGNMAGALFENYCIQETVKCYANLGEQPRISYLRPNNGLEVDLIIEGHNLRPLPVEIKLSKTPTPALASGLSRYASLFAKADPEEGLLLCLADGTNPLARGVTATGVKDFLDQLPGRI